MNIRLNDKLITNLGSVFPQPMADIVKATGIANSTWYDMMKAPDGITVRQLLSIANGLHIPVRRLFSSGKADIIGQREDYVAEPFTPCYYDETALHEFVNSHREATWKAAGQAAGMTWSGLRNSLLAVRRCPVPRFLTACQTLGVDPFDILVDPNPEPKAARRRTSGSAERFKADIDALRKDVDGLHATVEELTGKYEQLLKAHEALLSRIQVNIGTISGGNISNIGIAADPITSPTDD